jgi:hypothetical protein
MNFFHQQRVMLKVLGFQRTLWLLHHSFLHYWYSRLRTLQKDAYCFGYNYRNRPAMGDIFGIEKALFGCLWTTIPKSPPEVTGLTRIQIHAI